MGKRTPEYLRHDYNTRMDEKIIRLIFNMGWKGYGLYWAIVELIYIGDGKIKNDITMLAHELRATVEDVEQVVHKHELFYEKDGNIRNKAINKRLEEREGISEKRALSAMKRWSANALQTECKSNASIEQNRIVQNSIEKKEDKSKRTFSPPLIEQVRAYCIERGNIVNPDKWFAYYESNGWLVGKNKMKDWKAAVRTWEHSNYGPQANNTQSKPIPGKYEGIGEVF